jgi:hypothetical protein
VYKSNLGVFGSELFVGRQTGFPPTPCNNEVILGTNALNPSPIIYETKYVSLKRLMYGMKRTELVQATRAEVKTNDNNGTLCFVPATSTVSLKHELITIRDTEYFFFLQNLYGENFKL